MENTNNSLDFKILYNNYINCKNIETESILLKTILFDCEFFVCFTQSNEGETFELDTDENNKLILKIYSDYDEIEDRKKDQFSVGKIDFDVILDIVNESIADEICINPLTDCFKITSSQLMDLYRQKLYADTLSPIKLHEEKDFLKPAYKISEKNSKTNSNKIIQLYDIYMKAKDEAEIENTLSDFYKELINNATFFADVLPEEGCPKDENGNPLITKKRVLYFNEGNKGNYLFFIDSSQMAMSDEENGKVNYFSTFNFDDIITMIDSAYGVIKSIKIYGDLDLTIPVEVINELKVQKDRNNDLTGGLVLSSAYSETAEIQSFEEDLKNYFIKQKNVEKLWLGIEQYIYKDKSMHKVFNIFLKLQDESDEINYNEIRKILKNNCFQVLIVNNEMPEKDVKLIFEN